VPEHRAETPAEYRVLESFLWHGFKAGRSDWKTWVLSKLPETSAAAARAAFDRAIELHGSLRWLQAENSGMQIGVNLAASLETLNRLITCYRIQPRLGQNGNLSLASDNPSNPVSHLLLMALSALQSGSWRRFKLCSDPKCRASYFDASKATAKTWCSMATCGSRNKMRRYRARI
jgi:predicted RNA-binding Zn ribbon-like protein